MRSAVILHSVSDARHCFDNKLYEGNMLFSTHSSVDVYLKEKHGLDCRCLSAFMSTEELINEKKIWRGKADSLLKDLDSRLAPVLNERFGLKMNYFIPLYSILGSFCLLGYVCFVSCVKKITALYGLEKISFYDYRLNRYLTVSTTVGDLVSLFLGDIETEIIKAPENRYASKAGTIFENMLTRTRRLKGGSTGFISRKILEMTYKDRFRKFSDKKKTILVSELLYELEFLCSSTFSRYNVLYYDFGKERFLGFKERRSNYDVNLDFNESGLIRDTSSPFLKILLKDIREDFMANINRYLKGIGLIKDVSGRHPISLGIWGVSPAWKMRAMIFEYLRSNNIKIVGAQHGCLYGEVYSPWHFDADFNRCDYFISWGFTEDDLKRIHPSTSIDTKILPFGKTEIVCREKASKKVGLLFPVSMSLSLFEGGMDGVFPDKQTMRQTRLLRYLDSLGSTDVYVKPFMGSNYQNCSVLPVLKKLKNLKIIDNVPLTEFLEKYLPKAVLMEVPSQPLFDVLPLDTEIFLMDNPVYPYEEKALDELKRRVHYCEDVDGLISKVDLFLKGKLEKKRDSTFYRHYMYKENTKEKISVFVDSLIA